jgi:hypothetical protein
MEREKAQYEAARLADLLGIPVLVYLDDTGVSVRFRFEPISNWDLSVEARVTRNRELYLANPNGDIGPATIEECEGVFRKIRHWQEVTKARLGMIDMWRFGTGG